MTGCSGLLAALTTMATDETGGMYAVSTHARCRLDADPGGVPRITWRELVRIQDHG